MYHCLAVISQALRSLWHVELYDPVTLEATDPQVGLLKAALIPPTRVATKTLSHGKDPEPFLRLSVQDLSH